MSKTHTAVCALMVALFLVAISLDTNAVSNVSANKITAEPPSSANPQGVEDALLKLIQTRVRAEITAQKLSDLKAAGFFATVSRKAGVITVIGAFPGRALRAKIINIIKQTNGVRAVRNRLKAIPGTQCGPNEIDCLGDGKVCAKTQAECGVILD